ncbi:hypothetical protein C8J55DRAFT_563529 [Lentinula edodes]|uniref:DUF4246 domain-containing protein n=1 Tax=Lentinula lateritia TaxID=40482 RepID=A0A9W9A2N4_9AGAR|nr:hypothetical protein C8J55DRAFT_563529 [Lentinula edodes]
MGKLSRSIRSQPNWWQSYQNKSIRQIWTEDAIIEGIRNVTITSSIEIVRLSEKQISYVLPDELHALLREIGVSYFGRIEESDCTLDSTTLSTLNKAFEVLKTDKTFAQDTSTVIVVDPARHPLVYSRTLISSPTLRTWPPPRPTDIYTMSRKFALLPSDVSVSPSNDTKFLSYIDDINPQLHESYISSIPIREGLAVVFPNIYQHKLAPITVRDPSKVGKFTVLSFLLVDLDALPVISTANVAPQQRAWMWKALDGCLAVEIVEKILDMVDGLMDEQESQGH